MSGLRRAKQALKDYPLVIEAFNACMAADTYSFDLETAAAGWSGKSFSPLTGKIMGFSVAVDTELVDPNCWHKCCDPKVKVPKSWYFQFMPELETRLSNEDALKKYPGEIVPALLVWQLFKFLFLRQDKRMVGANLKFDIKFLMYIGLEIKNQIVDTTVASWILDENRMRHGLKFLVETIIGHIMVGFNELQGLFSPPIETYGADDACQVLRLWRHFEPLIKAQGLLKVYLELECSLPVVLAGMENRGCSIDLEVISSMRSEIGEELIAVEKECYELAGRRFNIGSPADLNKLLFKELKWKVRGRLKKTIHGYTTNREMMERYEKDNPLAAGILRHRELSKIEGTYLNNLEKAAQKIDGRVRSHFNQVVRPEKGGGSSGGGTVTGRLSSSTDEELGGVNLQTIPSRSKVGKRIREAFVAEFGNILVTFDYGQIELRFLAHFSQDPTLMDAYQCWDCVSCGNKGRTSDSLHACPICLADEGHRRREKNCKLCDEADVPEDAPVHGFCLGLDIHQITADACKIDRATGKKVNFALLYGQGEKGLARELKCSQMLARKIRNGYFSKYSGIVAHNARVQAEIIRFGYVTTILKRRRRFPHIKGKCLELWDREWRAGASAKIQGSAADLMKVATRNIDRKLEEKGLNTPTTGLILQVHDEVTIEAPEAHGGFVYNLVQYEMEHAFKISLPILAAGGTGRAWSDTK